MAPDEAADVLAELEEETSDEILEEMEHEPKHEVEELLEFDEDTGGRPDEYRVRRAAGNGDGGRRAARRSRTTKSLLETLNTLFLVDRAGAAERRGSAGAAVPARRRRSCCRTLAAETLIEVPVKEHQDRVTELFDKYNLLALPVVDEDQKLTGVITADDIISVLRQK